SENRIDYAQLKETQKATPNQVKIVAPLFAATVGFWSVVAAWALNDENYYVVSRNHRFSYLT
ncbi:MAG: hypothetical protein WB689_36190, partial [Xanthobacteraceae bacterium]